MHALPEAEWAEAQRSGQYQPNSFEEHGYIQLVDPARIVEATNERYAGEERDDISLFAVYTESFDGHLRYEDIGGRRVPCLHCSITPSSIAQWGPFPRDRGGFHLPKWAVEITDDDRLSDTAHSGGR